MALLKEIMCKRLTSLRIAVSMYRQKYTIDYSKFPKLDESEIEEQFIKGHGPGGSNVNKTTNCVLLKHKPTGIIVKCHESRLLQENQKLARENLLSKLDDLYNGDMSISAQKKRISIAKKNAMERKKEELREMKKQFYSQINQDK